MPFRKRQGNPVLDCVDTSTGGLRFLNFSIMSTENQKAVSQSLLLLQNLALHANNTYGLSEIEDQNQDLDLMFHGFLLSPFADSMDARERLLLLYEHLKELQNIFIQHNWDDAKDALEQVQTLKDLPNV